MSNRYQEFVACAVTIGIVDVFKPVKVSKQDSGAGMGASGAKSGVLQAFVQERPVRQSGERVMQSMVLEQVGRLARCVTGPRIEQVRSGYVGKRLRNDHVMGAEVSGFIAV